MQELFGVEKKLRDYIINCLRRVQIASPEFEELIDLILMMQKDDYSDSLEAIQRANGILFALTGCIFDESNLKKVSGFAQLGLSSNSILEGLKILSALSAHGLKGMASLSALSNLKSVTSLIAIPSLSALLAANLPAAALIGAGLAIVSILLHGINLAITSYDIRKDPKQYLQRT